MNPIKYCPGPEDQYPHAADVLERQVAENGFSAGWCMHAKPTVEYLYDFHVHYADITDTKVSQVIAPCETGARQEGVRRTLLILKMHSGDKADPESGPANGDMSYTPAQLAPLLEGTLDNPAVDLSAWLHYSSADKDLVHQAKALGFRVIKLHNAPVIEDAAACDLWYSPEWQQAFGAMAQERMPVLWHVTQRLPGCTYTGGGKNTYWKTGWKNGVRYGNEELLQVFLGCLARNPTVNFVGAHQLHLGWERLDKLFAGYPNLYVDTTIGCVLKLGDSFYPHDKDYLRHVFIKWSDRILFGTDNYWMNENADYANHMIKQHKHFLTALDLPEQALHNICHRNAERLLNRTAIDN